MSNTAEWPIRSPKIVDFPRPRDFGDPSTPVVFNADGVLTCIALLPAHASRLAGDELLGATTVTIEHDPDSFEWANGTTIRIDTADGTYDLVTISSVDSSAKTITFAPGLTADSAAFAAFAEYVGPEITGAAYGTPTLAGDDWGWSAEFPYDHLVLQKAQMVRFEGRLVSASTGARIFRWFDLLVTSGMRQSQRTATWVKGESLFLDVVALLDYVDPGTPVIARGASVIEARVYEYGVESRLAASYSPAFAGPLVITDDVDVVGFEDDRRVHIDGDSGTHEHVTITGPTGTSLPITGVTTNALSKGARVQQLLGNSGASYKTSGVSYGTADATEEEGWGFTCEIPYDFIKNTTLTMESSTVSRRLLVSLEITHAGTGQRWEQEWFVSIVEPYQAP